MKMGPRFDFDLVKLRAQSSNVTLFLLGIGFLFVAWEV